MTSRTEQVTHYDDSVPHSHTQGAAAVFMVATLGLLSLFPPLATDMYLAAFGDMAKYLNAPDGTMEMSLSLFFLGMCIGQLIFGPMADHLGRKGPLMLGAAIFCVTTIALLSTHSASVFLGLRIIQALGACAGMVIGRAIVTDLFKGNSAARTIAVLMTLSTLGPVLAPLVGGILINTLGWRAVFWTMLIVGVVALVLSIIFLPESLPRQKRNKEPVGQLLRKYGNLVTSGDFLVPSICSALILGTFFTFITTSSSVLQGVMGLGNVTYGLCFGIIALGLVIASMLNAKILGSVSLVRIVNIALPVLVVMTFILLMLSRTHSLITLMIPLWLSVAAVGFLVANTTSLAMSHTHGYAGAGSALMGAVQFGMAFLCSSLASALIGNSALPLGLGMFVPSILACLLWFATAKRREARIAAEKNDEKATAAET